MAIFMGRLGAIYAPVGTTDLSGVPLAQVGGGTEFVIADGETRIQRAFLESAEPSDFSASSGTVTALKKPVGAVTISGGTPPYTLTSTGGQVAKLAPVGGFLDWRLDVDQSLADVTTLGMAQRTRRRVLRAWTAQAQRFWLDERFSVDVAGTMEALGDPPFVLSFFVSTESTRIYRYVGFAAVEGLAIDAPVGAMVEQALRFRGHGPLYFRRASD